MTPAEREMFKTLDRLVLGASGAELKRIQEIDRQTQLGGLSFYDAYINSKTPAKGVIQEPGKPRR